PRRGLWFAVLPVLLASVLVGVPAAAAAEDDLLAAERWLDNTFGLSLRPPQEAQMVQAAADGAVVKFVNEPAYTISVFIRQGERELDFKALREQTALEVSYGSREANLIDDRDVHYGGRSGVLTYYRLKRGRDEEWLFGQAMLRIDPTT